MRRTLNVRYWLIWVAGFVVYFGAVILIGRAVTS